jgi:hypothetical protein
MNLSFLITHKKALPLLKSPMKKAEEKEATGMMDHEVKASHSCLRHLQIIQICKAFEHQAMKVF